GGCWNRHRHICDDTDKLRFKARRHLVSYYEDSGQIIHNILWMTEQDETRCSERGLQPQLFHNFCLKSDGIRRAKMKGKSALFTADLPFFVIFTSAPNYT